MSCQTRNASMVAGSRDGGKAQRPLPDSIVREDAGRTFAIIELAVAAEYRRRGIAKAMHDALLTDASEERVTLLVRPEAMPARSAYEHWGYAQVGTIRPWPEAPLYDAMVLDLRHRG
jgi:ribosomal protein S18 acetylase RimI-like enzyme